MPQQVYDIIAIQGSTLLLRVNLQYSDGTAIDLNGYGVRGYVKGKYSDSGILLNLNPSIYNATSGIISISGISDELANLPVGKFPYDIEVTGVNNYVLKPLRGYFNVLPEATY